MAQEFASSDTDTSVQPNNHTTTTANPKESNGGSPIEEPTGNHSDQSAAPLTPPMTPPLKTQQSPSYVSVLPASLQLHLGSLPSSIQSKMPNVSGWKECTKWDYIMEKIPVAYQSAKSYAVDRHPSLTNHIDKIEHIVADAYQKTKSAKGISDVLHVASDVAGETNVMVTDIVKPNLKEKSEYLHLKVNDLHGKLVHIQEVVSKKVSTSSITSATLAVSASVKDKMAHTAELTGHFTEAVKDAKHATQEGFQQKMTMATAKISNTVDSTVFTAAHLVDNAKQSFGEIPNYSTMVFSAPVECTKAATEQLASFSTKLIENIKTASPRTESFINETKNAPGKLYQSGYHQYECFAEKSRSAYESVSSQAKEKFTLAYSGLKSQAELITLKTLESKYTKSVFSLFSTFVDTVTNNEKFSVFTTDHMPSSFATWLNGVHSAVIKSPQWETVSLIMQPYFGHSSENDKVDLKE